MGSKFVVFISQIGKAQAWIERLSATIAAAIILAMMLLTTADVVGRYVFNNPVIGTVEVSEFMLLGIVFLSVGYVQAVRGHIAVEVITSWLPRRTQIGLEIFGHILGLFLYSIITWKTGVQAYNAWSIGDFSAGVIEFPLWPAKSLIPLGMGILCLRLVSDIPHDFAKWLALGAKSSGSNKGAS